MSAVEGIGVDCPLRVGFLTEVVLTLAGTGGLFVVVDETGVACLRVDLNTGLIGDVDLDPWSEGSGLFPLPCLLSVEAPPLPFVEVVTELTEALGL